MGVKKEFTVEVGYWKTDLIDGKCKTCKKGEDEENEKKNKEKAIQETIQKGIEIVGGEYAYRNYNFDSYKPKTKSQENALNICRSLDPQKENLILVGPAGVGKSHLACAIILSSILRLLSAQRWRVTELLRHIRKFNDNAKIQDEEIKKIINSKPLLIEDIGVEKDTTWGTSILWEIIDNRIDKGINGLILTTNIGRSKMAEAMSDRIPSRITQLCKTIYVEGPDHRIENMRS